MGVFDRVATQRKAFTMQLFFQNLSGRHTALEASATDEVSLLKQKVEDREGIPPAEQRLLWQGRELVNSSTLAECSLGEGDCFRVVLRVCGGAPKKKKKGGDDNPAELSEDEQKEIFKMRIEFLERELMLKKEEAVEAIHAKNELRERVKEYHDEFEREKMRTLDITADMTRQYKEINELENQILDLHDQLKLSEMKLERHKTETKKQMEEKDKVIQDQSHRMEQMAAEFGSMLEETLKKMTDRIEISSKKYEEDEAEDEEDEEEEDGASQTRCRSMLFRGDHKNFAAK